MVLHVLCAVLIFSCPDPYLIIKTIPINPAVTQLLQCFLGDVGCCGPRDLFGKFLKSICIFLHRSLLLSYLRISSGLWCILRLCYVWMPTPLCTDRVGSRLVRSIAILTPVRHEL